MAAGKPSSRSISSVPDFHANPSPSPEREWEKRTNGISGPKRHDSFATYDRHSSCWRTSQVCLFTGILDKYSESWPKAGMTVSGIAFRLLPSVPRTSGNGCGFLPTPTVSDAVGGVRHNIGQRRMAQKFRDEVVRKCRRWKIPTMGANEYKGSGRDRYLGSQNFRGAKMSEGLRTCEDDPIYLNPSFAELVMGFPVGWTELGVWETPSSLRLQDGSDSC